MHDTTMTPYERVLYRERGAVKTVILRDGTEGSWTLSGTRVNGQGKEDPTKRGESFLVIHLTRSIISRTPLRLNTAQTRLEEIDTV